ncbi:hypothetical protein GH714_016498 [Hevea brasiliensis]|uniref:F-box domain-containing protein n=1 Tax=Hevea brasiliensis TaxID=3981 RepID=A0A6A6ME05_HEVBR|nr:hypothetical protein GH714_016498 [Hevea brasiliensis]
MENPRNLSTNSIGFCLLPSELIHRILLNLLIPEILCLKSLNKSLSDLISDQHLYAITIRDRSLPPGSSSTRNAGIATLCFTAFPTVKRIPPSPLGPRGTSSWRRSGMKLVSGSNSFRFLFAELVENRPVLFVYTSETDKWLSMEARENFAGLPRGFQREDDYIFLNVVNGPYESVVMMAGLESDDAPVVVRPRFEGGRDDEQQLTVGYSWGNVIDRLYVHGDGHMLIIKSNGGVMRIQERGC